MFDVEPLEEALGLLGARLAELGAPITVLVIGGSSLLLLGVIERPTADVDVVAVAGDAGYLSADPLPTVLTDAVAEVGRVLGLDEKWLNSGPADLLTLGLPVGLAGRVTVRRYEALEVHLPARTDMVCFKLYAAVDRGERDKHFYDLRALAPSLDELVAAARWTRTHDPSAGFRGELVRILGLLGVEVGDAEAV